MKSLLYFIKAGSLFTGICNESTANKALNLSSASHHFN